MLTTIQKTINLDNLTTNNSQITEESFGKTTLSENEIIIFSPITSSEDLDFREVSASLVCSESIRNDLMIKFRSSNQKTVLIINEIAYSSARRSNSSSCGKKTRNYFLFKISSLELNKIFRRKEVPLGNKSFLDNKNVLVRAYLTGQLSLPSYQANVNDEILIKFEEEVVLSPLTQENQIIHSNKKELEKFSMGKGKDKQPKNIIFDDIGEPIRLFKLKPSDIADEIEEAERLEESRKESIKANRKSKAPRDPEDSSFFRLIWLTSTIILFLVGCCVFRSLSKKRQLEKEEEEEEK